MIAIHWRPHRERWEEYCDRNSQRKLSRWANIDAVELRAICPGNEVKLYKQTLYHFTSTKDQRAGIRMVRAEMPPNGIILQQHAHQRQAVADSLTISNNEKPEYASRLIHRGSFNNKHCGNSKASPLDTQCARDGHHESNDPGKFPATDCVISGSKVFPDPTLRVPTSKYARANAPANNVKDTPVIKWEDFVPDFPTDGRFAWFDMDPNMTGTHLQMLEKYNSTCQLHANPFFTGLVARVPTAATARQIAYEKAHMPDIPVPSVADLLDNGHTGFDPATGPSQAPRRYQIQGSDGSWDDTDAAPRPGIPFEYAADARMTRIMDELKTDPFSTLHPPLKSRRRRVRTRTEHPTSIGQYSPDDHIACAIPSTIKHKNMQFPFLSYPRDLDKDSAPSRLPVQEPLLATTQDDILATTSSDDHNEMSLNDTFESYISLGEHQPNVDSDDASSSFDELEFQSFYNNCFPKGL